MHWHRASAYKKKQRKQSHEEQRDVSMSRNHKRKGTAKEERKRHVMRQEKGSLDIK